MRSLLLILGLSLSLSSVVYAESSLSTPTQGAKASLVNPDIQRLEVPPTPQNMPLPSFGKGVIGWGSGPDGAQLRLDHVTQADVAEMKRKGLTLEMATAWQLFYENETQRNAGNPTAPLRAQLMKKITQLW